jgi:hypothetical protein
MVCRCLLASSVSRRFALLASKQWHTLRAYVPIRFHLALWSALTALGATALFGADPPVFPGTTWATRSPADAGLDAARLNALRDFVGGRGCVVRGGTLVYTWGDVTRRADVASACKPVYVHFLLAAVESNRLPGVDAPVVRWEPRLASLNAALGFKDRAIAWRHLACQTSCYGVSEPPGGAFDYNDFNMALLFDTLTRRVYGLEYDRIDAELLGPRLADRIGCEDRPTLLAFGIENRPGRLAISVRDFARFGLLYLREGRWNGAPLLRSDLVRLALGSPVAASLPRTRGRKAEMIPSQRSLGGGINQTDHFGGYSFAWWLNGVDREGRRHWPGAPADTFAALGHGGQRGLAVIPSLDLVVSWNDSRLDSPEKENRALATLAASVREKPKSPHTR